MFKWQIKLLYVKIVHKNSYSLRVNRNFTKKKDSKMNHKDVLIVEELKNNKTIEDFKDNII